MKTKIKQYYDYVMEQKNMSYAMKKSIISQNERNKKNGYHLYSIQAKCGKNKYHLELI